MADDLLVPTRRRLRKRKRVDADAIVDHVLTAVQSAIDERDEWMRLRETRYAKFRGWLESQTGTWDDASNQHIPVMAANKLRVDAGLFNAVMGIRPMMTPKVLRRELKEQAERANNLIDFQLFVENDGEQLIEQYIDQFTTDGTAVAFTPWVKDRRTVTDVRTFPAPDRPWIEAIPDEILSAISPSFREVTARDADGARWRAILDTPERRELEVSIEVYDKRDDEIEVVLEWEATSFNGPTMIVDDLEDVVVPMRCENPQPVTPQNPHGAPWVARLPRISLDEVRRRQASGEYDLVTKKDLDEMPAHAEDRVPIAQADERDAIRTRKDEQAGLRPGFATTSDGKGLLTLVQWYGGYDIDGDGLEEEVIFWVAKEPKKLLRWRHLSEQYPGLPLWRPISHTCCIPVKGQFYGIGFLELMEGLHDFLHVCFNQTIDYGTLTNQPFGFYRASSGLKPEIIRLQPGELHPLDNPQQDVAFPMMPNANQSWGFNMIGLGMQLMQQLTQIGPLQQGQVPTGKASALRTMGTTMAILQQGAAMPETILRHLFHGLRQVWTFFHLLNVRFLPKQKAFLIAGKPLDQDEAYGMIEDPARDLDLPLAWDIQATLLNTNKGLVAQSLMQIGSAVINPLFMQSGLSTPEEWYNWAKDLIQAAQLDPARYLRKPQGMPEGPRLTAEEVLLTIMDGHLPGVAPLEAPEEHFQKLVKILNGPEMGLLTEGQTMLLRQYLMGLTAFLRQQAQQAQMMQAAAQFSTALGQGGQGQGAQPGMPPEMQTEAPSLEEIGGSAVRDGGS